MAFNLQRHIKEIVQHRTVRLVTTARFRDSALKGLVPDKDLPELEQIEAATSGRLRALENGLAKLDKRELVHGVPHENFINAAFSYPNPGELNRFNGSDRGAWYAALDVNTCVAEVSHHMVRELQYVSDFNATVDYAELFAGFMGRFVDLRDVNPVPPFLSADTAKAYPLGNIFAEEAIANDCVGIIYPSVRRPKGVCIVVLRPNAVQSVAQGRVLRLTWNGKPAPSVEEIK